MARRGADSARLVSMIFLFIICYYGAEHYLRSRDRPWQAYPITIVSGAYVGYALGSAMGRSPVLYGRRIQFSSSAEEMTDEPEEVISAEAKALEADVAQAGL